MALPGGSASTAPIALGSTPRGGSWERSGWELAPLGARRCQPGPICPPSSVSILLHLPRSSLSVLSGVRDCPRGLCLQSVRASLPFSESIFSSSSVKGFLLGNAGRCQHCPLSFLWRRGWWCLPGCFQKPEGGRAGLARPFEPHVWSWSGPAGFIRPCSQARTTYSALGVLAGPPDSSLTPSPGKWRGHRESQHRLGSCLRDTLTPERETTDQWFVSSSDATESFHLDSHPMLPTSQQGLIYHDVASFTAMRFSCRGS